MLAPLRPCGEQGCPELTRGGRCTRHEAARQKAINARRPSSAARGYGTSRWQAYREHWKQRHPLCGDRRRDRSDEHSHCVATGRLTPMYALDHIIPVTGPADPLFWNPDNHQSLCASCHSSKTMRELNVARAS